MKKLTALLLILALLALPAYAEDAPAEPLFTSVTVHLRLESEAAVLKEQTLVFELLDGSNNASLGEKTIKINGDTLPYIDLSFTTPAYEIGKAFFLHMKQGEAELGFDGARGAYFTLQTYSAPTADGSRLDYCTDFYMTLTPAAGRIVNLKLDGESRPDLALYAYPEGILIPAEALGALGIASVPLSDGGLTLSKGDVSLLLYPGQLCAYKNGEAFNLALAPQSVDGAVCVPVADTASVFGCEVEYGDDGCTLSLSLGYASVGQNAAERLVNGRGLVSDTNYLIWVSKGEYTVRVFKGQSGGWHQINSFPCAIGAPATPTVEGTFKYYQYQSRWEYPTYYVGPIMRFYGGYAIHSTLLRYNGANADARVGVRISHGCVRVRPANIKWLVDTIPLQTTIYVTA